MNKGGKLDTTTRTETMTKEINPPNNENFDRCCPFCKHEVPYFGLNWTTVVSYYDGTLVRRRIGPCTHCKRWLRAVIVWPDEGTGSFWAVQPLHPFEIEQVEKHT